MMNNPQNQQQPQIHINVGSLFPRPGEKNGSKLKQVQPAGVFDIPSGLDGAISWSLSWVCMGGLFVPVVKMLDLLQVPPIVAPIFGICFVLWLLLEVARSQRIEVGVALGCALAGALVGVMA